METIICENWFSRKEDFPRVATSQTRHHLIQKQTIYNIKKILEYFLINYVRFFLKNTANNKVDFFFVKLQRRCQKYFRRFRIYSGFSPLMQKKTDKILCCLSVR